MAFIGFRQELEELPAGEYSEIVDTGEVFDSKQDIEEYGWAWYPHDDTNDEVYFSWEEIDDAGLDEGEDGEWVQEPFTVDTFTIEPIYITLQNDTTSGEDFYWMYNVNRGFDSIPPDMVGKVHEAESWDEAIEEANRLAKELSGTDDYINVPVGVTAHSAEAYGDVYAVYLNGREE